MILTSNQISFSGSLQGPVLNTGRHTGAQYAERVVQGHKIILLIGIVISLLSRIYKIKVR